MNSHADRHPDSPELCHDDAESGEPLEQRRGPTLRERLSRVTSNRTYFPIIDGLRFIAIASVVLYHINDYTIHKLGWAENAAVQASPVQRVLAQGFIGVPQFFAISGLILGIPLLTAVDRKQEFDLRRYFARRVTRLEPPYIINLVLIALLLVVVKEHQPESLIAPFVSSMFYVHNILYGTMSTINGVAWSLEIEVQFYILAPLLAYTIYRWNRSPRRVLLLTLIATAVFMKYQFADHLGPRFRLSLLNYLDTFLIGMLLADIFVTDWKSHPQTSWSWDIAAIACWPVGWFLLQSHNTSPFVSLAILAGIFCTLQGRFHTWWLTRPWITVAGGMCYTIYLYHFFVISLVGRTVLPIVDGLSYLPAFLIIAGVTIPAVAVVSSLLFLLIEKPFMIWQPFPRSSTERADAPAPVLGPKAGMASSLQVRS